MRTTWILIGWYAAMSLVTFSAYAIDKGAAGFSARRIRERTLHALALLGGWPGALIAIVARRHKTRKVMFLAVVWAAVTLHLVFLTWWFTRR